MVASHNKYIIHTSNGGNIAEVRYAIAIYLEITINKIIYVRLCQDFIVNNWIGSPEYLALG